MKKSKILNWRIGDSKDDLWNYRRRTQRKKEIAENSLREFEIANFQAKQRLYGRGTLGAIQDGAIILRAPSDIYFLLMADHGGAHMTTGMAQSLFEKRIEEISAAGYSVEADNRIRQFLEVTKLQKEMISDLKEYGMYVTGISQVPLIMMGEGTIGEAHEFFHARVHTVGETMRAAGHRQIVKKVQSYFWTHLTAALSGLKNETSSAFISLAESVYADSQFDGAEEVFARVAQQKDMPLEDVIQKDLQYMRYRYKDVTEFHEVLIRKGLESATTYVSLNVGTTETMVNHMANELATLPKEGPDGV